MAVMRRQLHRKQPKQPRLHWLTSNSHSGRQDRTARLLGLLLLPPLRLSPAVPRASGQVSMGVTINHLQKILMPRLDTG